MTQESGTYQAAIARDERCRIAAELLLHCSIDSSTSWQTAFPSHARPHPVWLHSCHRPGVPVCSVGHAGEGRSRARVLPALDRLLACMLACMQVKQPQRHLPVLVTLPHAPPPSKAALNRRFSEHSATLLFPRPIALPPLPFLIPNLQFPSNQPLSTFNLSPSTCQPLSTLRTSPTPSSLFTLQPLHSPPYSLSLPFSLSPFPPLLSLPPYCALHPSSPASVAQVRGDRPWTATRRTPPSSDLPPSGDCRPVTAGLPPPLQAATAGGR